MHGISVLHRSVPVVFLLVLCASAASAQPTLPPAIAGHALPDTIYLMGGPDRQDGDFQNDLNPAIPDDEGWQLPYLAEPPLWHIDTVNAELLDPGQTENHAMWCGKYFAPCWGETEPNPGYGPYLDEWLEWAGTVDDSALPTDVRLTAILNYDTEPGYDFLYLEVADAAGYARINYFNGTNKSNGIFVPVNADYVFTVVPADYQGDSGDEVHLRWRFVSDGGFNDQDCYFPSTGAAQIDNITVSFDQGGGPIQQTSDDFEAGSPVNWFASRINNCGYARIWPRLDDAGLCEDPNNTPRLAFIDDGTQCDDTPSFGTDITYGPDGMVVECTGVPNYPGTSGEFWSPAMELPDNSVYESVRVEFDVYLHQAYGFVKIRTSSDGEFSWSPWSSIISGSAGLLNWRFASPRPVNTRYSVEFHNSIREGTNLIQVSLGVQKDSSYPDCTFSSPAPYYDNVAVKVYRNSGPILNEAGFENISLYIPDNFPTSGSVDTIDLANNDVRLDPIDRTVSLPRSGSVLAGPPEMHWILNPNPLFDSYRTNLPANPIVGDFVDDVSSPSGFPTSKYQFDFPQDGFVFPGDELHYYFRVQDDVAGDIATTIQPADTTGFGSFDSDQTGMAGPFPQRFIFRGLPTLSAADPDSQPKILVWDASNNAAETDDLMLSLAQLGYRPGRDYDLLRSGILGWNNYSSIKTGHFGYTTIIAVRDDENYSHDSNIDTWIELGGRNLLLVGNNIGTASAGSDILPETLIGAAMEEPSVRPFIDDQGLPGLAATGLVSEINVPLVAHGCDYPQFDAMGLRNTGQSLYEFTAPGGTPGGYPYPAAIYNYIPSDDARVITVPIAFSRLVSPDHFGGGLPARTVFLDQVLTFFGHTGTNAPSPVPELQEFSVRAYPNPFNPRTTIAFNLPQKSAVNLHIYDLAGHRVRTLLDGDELQAGPNSVVWTGRDSHDRLVAAGVYFYRLEAGINKAVRRVTLIK